MKPNTHVCVSRAVCVSVSGVCAHKKPYLAGWCAGRGTGRVGEKALSGQRWRLECGESSVSEHTGQAGHVRRGKVARPARARDARYRRFIQFNGIQATEGGGGLGGGGSEGSFSLLIVFHCRRVVCAVLRYRRFIQ